MASEHEAMWQELGLDLAAHDQLLQVLGDGYGQIFLSQQQRPEGMEYFNFVMSEVHGLRIKELVDGKAEGKKVIGSFCVFVPEEIVRAADATLVGLCTGADFATDLVDQVLPRNTCALIKSAFGFKLGKVCPYMESADMIVGENTCDGKKKSYETLADLVPNLYVMDLPQVKSQEGRALLAAEYQRFKEAVEELTGIEITAERLAGGIKIVNDKREALHRLYKLRAVDPAPISGLDALLINQVSFYDDPVRFTASVHKICDELEERIKASQGVTPKGAPRLLFSGCPMAVPNWKVPWIVESSGAGGGGRGVLRGRTRHPQPGGAPGRGPGVHDGGHRGALLADRLRRVHSQPRARGARQADGRRLRGPGGDPLRPPVLPALPDGVVASGEEAGGHGPAGAAHGDRLQHGRRGAAQDPSRSLPGNACLISLVGPGGLPGPTLQIPLHDHPP